MSKRDYYETLEVNRDCTSDEIKKSFRKLAQKYHPDKNPNNPEAEAKFKELGEAYETLMDDDRRAAYDRFGHNANRQGAGPSVNPFDMFNAAFHGNFGGFNGDFFSRFSHNSGNVNQHGETLQQVIELTLEEAYNGCDKEITVNKLDTCTSCNGTGSRIGSKKVNCNSCNGHGQIHIAHGPFHIAQPCPACRGVGISSESFCSTCNGDGRTGATHTFKISVPRGIDANCTLRVAGGGMKGVRGAPAGDLLLLTQIKPHATFRREGKNLHCKINVPYITAILGGTIEVPGVNTTHSYNIISNTTSGTVLCLKGAGITTMEDNTPGDIFAEVIIDILIKLSKEQINELTKLSGF